jgi:hypothetical protein
MTKMIIKTGLAGAFIAASAVSASAALLDFTDNASYGVRSGAIASGTLADGNTWTLLPTPATFKLSYVTSDAPMGAPSTSPLKGDNDGVGVTKPTGSVNDEITAPDQMITLTFSKAVKLTTLYFLDLFRSGSSVDTEEAYVSVDGSADAVFSAQEAYVPGGFGFGKFASSLAGKSFTFSAGDIDPTNNDDVGQPDYALAGADVSPVPLPAGFLLLGGALAGMGIARRRRKS